MPPVRVGRPKFHGSRLYTKRITTRPLSPEDETMMQALHDKWGHPSKVYLDPQGTKQSGIYY